MLMGSGYSRPADGHPSGVEIGFLTGEVPAAFDRAIGQGATPITAPRRMPWGLEVAYVRAPEGTMIGFSEPPPTFRYKRVTATCTGETPKSRTYRVPSGSAN